MPRAKKNPKIEALKVKIVSATMTGLYEKAAELAAQVKELEAADKAKAKVAKAKAKKTASKAPKRSEIASKTPKTTKTPSRAKKTIPKPTVDVEDEDDTSNYIAPSRPKGRNRDGSQFVGQDGKNHTYSRRVSMSGTNFKNQFDVKDYDVALPAKHAKVDSKLRKAKIGPRPGQAGATRQAAEKIPVRCFECSGDFEVYPWEYEKVDSKTRYICNDCSCAH